MVYGLISVSIHKSLTLPQACMAYVAFAVFMLLCSLAKDRMARRVRAGAPGSGKPLTPLRRIRS